MHKLIMFAGCAVAAIALSGCGANSAAQLDAIKSVVTDPNCQHDDKVELITGAAGVAASFHVSAERHCPVGGAPKPVVQTLSQFGATLPAAADPVVTITPITPH